MKIGVSLPQHTASNAEQWIGTRDVLEAASLAEASGLDSVWLIDHFFIPSVYDDMIANGEKPSAALRGVQVGAWECWSLASALAIATERVEIGTQVTNTGNRNPALLARLVDTVDDLSGGRVILGLGAGYFRSEYDAFGYAWENRVGRLEEALQIISPLLRGNSVSFNGTYYRTENARLLPKSPRSSGPPILIGSVKGGPRIRRLTAQCADYWNCYLAFGDSRPEALLPHRDLQFAACERVGRDPATLPVHVTVSVQPGDGGEAGPLAGSPKQIATQFARFRDLGVAHLVATLKPFSPSTLEVLAEASRLIR